MCSSDLDGYFYVQDTERGGGVRIISDRGFGPGDVVCVFGTITTVDGEKCITPRYLSLSVNLPRPLLVNSATLWNESGLDVFGQLV